MSLDRQNGRGKTNRNGHTNGKANGHTVIAPLVPTRLPPHNLEVERGTLGSILFDNGVLAKIRHFLRTADFYRDSHQIVYEAMLGLADRSEPIDTISLAEELSRRGQFEQVGGDEILASLAEGVPHAANGEFYARIVLEKSRARELIARAEALLKHAYAGQQTNDAILEETLAGLAEVKGRGIIGQAEAPFSLDLVDSASFFGQEYALDWLVRGVLVKGESAAMGGPSKSLKTSILIDLAVSLASATKFLGKFEVPRPVRVGLISGESGRRVIQSSARQVCLSRDLTSRDIGGIFWGFTLPQLTNAEHLSSLRKTIEDKQLECIIIDPFYLTILAGSAGVDVKSMFEMGPIISGVSQICIEAGCTPIIAHHFTKKRDDPFGPPELTDFAYGGFAQSIRQWMMVSPRERFDAEIGLFKLHFYFGGSAGHCGEYAVDIEVGKLDPDLDRRTWKVSIASPSEERQAKQEQRKAEAERKAEEKRKEVEAQRDREECDLIANAVEALKSEPNRRATRSRLRDLMGCGAEKLGRVLARMEKEGMARQCEVTIATGNGRSRATIGIGLVDGSSNLL